MSKAIDKSIKITHIQKKFTTQDVGVRKISESEEIEWIDGDQALIKIRALQGIVESPGFGEYVEGLANGILPEGSDYLRGLIELETQKGEVKKVVTEVVKLPDGDVELLKQSKHYNMLKDAKKLILVSAGAKVSVSITDFPDSLIPAGLKKCKECGQLFKKEGKRVFHSNKCRSRFHARKSMRKRRAKAAVEEKC